MPCECEKKTKKKLAQVKKDNTTTMICLVVLGVLVLSMAKDIEKLKKETAES